MPRKTAISRQRLAALTALAGATGVISALAASNIGSASGPGTWTTLEPSGPARQEVAFTQVGGKMYLFGGSGTEQQEVYDPGARTWSPPVNGPQVTGNLDHIQSVAVGGKIYYIGGLTSFPGPDVGTVHIFDPSSGWSTGASMPDGRERGAGGVAVHNGKIYYAGGLHTNAAGTTTAVNWFDEYNPATNTWRTLPNMPTARDHFHAAVLDGKFWAIGGRNKSISSATTVNEAYDYAGQAWTTGFAPLPVRRGGFAAAAVNCEIFIIGGEGNGDAFNDVEAYHPASNSWRTLSDMPTPRHGIQAAVLGNSIYIAAGGMDEGGGMKTDVLERFDPGAQSKCGSAPLGSVGGGGAGGPSGSIGDRTAPTIRQVTLSRPAFRTVRGRGLYGTRVNLSLSEKATLYMSVRKLRRDRPAKRIAGVVKRSVGAGSIGVLFRGRLDGRRLRPGRYRLVMVAVDAANNASAKARARFRVLR